MANGSVRKATAQDEAIVNVIVRVVGRMDRWLFRMSGGRKMFRLLGRGRADTLLLTTVGRKSGQKRTNPLIYLKDGENIVIVASKGGMPHHPLWYLNLMAHPEVEIEIGRERMPMTAREAIAEERSRLWPRLVELYADYDTYQKRTDRQIPVLILTRRQTQT